MVSHSGAMRLLVYGAISVLCSHISGRHFFTTPEDNPQACEWDIKICGDGTWVYRVAERSCEFDECMVEPLEHKTHQESSYSAPTRY
ncbi:hypothetical protein PRIC1_001102 [Phytophthora ramorum]